jgi:stress-induced morphogen
MYVEQLSETLIEEFNPKFLGFDFFDDNMNIVISSDCFINQSMQDRVKSVYNCIQEKSPNVLEYHRIFVHTFTQAELTDVLEYNKEGTNV